MWRISRTQLFKLIRVKYKYICFCNSWICSLTLVLTTVLSLIDRFSDWHCRCTTSGHTGTWEVCNCSRKKEKGVHFWSKIENDLNLTFLPVYLWLSVNVNLPWPFPHDQQCKIMVSVVISSLVNLEFQHRVGQTQCYILWLVYLLVFLLAHVHSVRTKQRLGFTVGILQVFSGISLYYF